jgi:hypothetical protein
VPSFFLDSESQPEDQLAGKLTDRCVLRETAIDWLWAHYPKRQLLIINSYSEVSTNSQSLLTDYSTEKQLVLAEGD